MIIMKNLFLTTYTFKGKPRRDSHSTSSDTDTEVSLPSKDQDFAEITNEDLGIAEDHFSQPEVRKTHLIKICA